MCARPRRPTPQTRPGPAHMRIKTFTLTALLLALLPAIASASTGQLALFQDDDGLVNGGAARRAATVSELQALGVDAVKIQLNWAEVAPRTKKKPAGFDGSDPSDYPGWAKFDDAVNAAQNGGFRVMIALSPPVPGWATAHQGDRSGVDRPSSREFARFAEAAGQALPVGGPLDALERAEPPGLPLPTGHALTGAVLAAPLPQPDQGRHQRTAQGGAQRRPDPVRGAAADRQDAHLPQEHDPAAALPARALLPRLEVAPLPRPDRHGPRLQGLSQDHRGERVRLSPLHPPGGPASQGAHAQRRHHPLARPHHPGARHRAAGRAGSPAEG